MAFSVNDVIGHFKFEGARPTLFRVRITNPVNGSADNQIQYLASATSIPESNLGNIAVPYFGRVVNFAGDRTYQPWRVTIMNDEDFKVRNALEQWSDAINQKIENTRVKTEYKTSADVEQLSKTGKILRTYRFVGIYPQTIEPIRLAWDDRDTFERFDVTFVYDYWEIIGNQTGDAGGKGKPPAVE